MGSKSYFPYQGRLNPTTADSFTSLIHTSHAGANKTQLLKARREARGVNSVAYGQVKMSWAFQSWSTKARGRQPAARGRRGKAGTQLDHTNANSSLTAAFSPAPEQLSPSTCHSLAGRLVPAEPGHWTSCWGKERCQLVMNGCPDLFNTHQPVHHKAKQRMGALGGLQSRCMSMQD